MNSYLISYDLIGPNRDYDSIFEKIKSYNGWARPLESVWLVKTTDSAETIRDEIYSLMDSNDKLFVIKVERVAGWQNLSDEVTTWLHNNL